MANTRQGDDLFEKSTMTFGEHLEELRGALVRSLVGLGLGFLVALYFADNIVQFIQTPLVAALKEHHVKRDQAKLEAMYGLSKGQSQQIAKFMRQQEVTFEMRLIEQSEIERLVELGSGGSAGQAPAAEAAAEPPSGDEPSGSEPSGDEPSGDESSGDESSGGESSGGESSGGESSGDGSSSDEAPPAATSLPPPPSPDSALQQVRLWRPSKAKVVALSMPEAFVIWLKAGFIGGLLLACPWIFVQIWTFVAAGLYPHERRYVHIYIPFSVGLFIAGAAMAFFVVFDYVLDFLLRFNATMALEAEPRISEWIGFVLFLPLGFGIAFQLPLGMLLLHRIGIFSIQAYTSKWRIAVLVIFVLSMMLTPAEPISMIAMAMPLTGLYFLGILLCHFMPRTRNPYAEGYDPAS